MAMDMSSESTIDSYTYSFEEYSAEVALDAVNSGTAASGRGASHGSHPHRRKASHAHIGSQSTVSHGLKVDVAGTKGSHPERALDSPAESPWWRRAGAKSTGAFVPEPAAKPDIPSLPMVEAGAGAGENNLTWRNVQYSVVSNENGEQLPILHGLSGTVAAGQTLAILGPSGSGKTSLLNILGGRVTENVIGDVALSGTPVTKVSRRKVGYVLQEDYLFSELSVSETLEFAAALSLPGSLTDAERSARVEALVADLRLSACINTRIGSQFKKGVSGGEKKRTNIAVELLNNPAVLLLDEPTSGLDAATALLLIKLLQRLAVSRSQAVITTIHQPSSQIWALFDYVLVLDKGHTAYFGPAADMIDTFSTIGITFPHHYNPADFVLEVVSHATDEARTKVRALGQSCIPHASIDMRLAAIDTGRSGSSSPRNRSSSDQYEASWLRQMWLLAKRAFKQNRGDVLSPVNFGQILTLAVVSAVIWWQIDDTDATIHDRVGLLFFATIFWGFFPLFHSMTTFTIERGIVKKERDAGMYSCSAYFVGKTLAETPIQLLLPAMWITVVFPSAGLSSEFSAYLVSLLLLLLHVVAGQSVGLIVGTIFVNVTKAMTVAGTALLTLMLISGFYVKTDNLPWDWLRGLQYLSILKYHWEAQVVNAIAGQTFACVDAANPSADFAVCPVTESAIRNFYDFDVEPWANAMVLLGFAILARLGAYGILRLRGV
ncbi:uncharacterized protein AMSG_01784 [Thecamonas trahens ATCC 50062]|uniref:ABC transporter domain-containing protein n=1 Tax=Thecamonas trahens ATCC 50062 TaxID=461836 RepID=A0A0L0DT40_THETB|nr:hypothetical protein AMSG_01784 [Thecamonas trahens ATCC 50062]KNC55519.1 hypothetical protein AMSG_01784 [Thecamonas trahens ATCC 50062]|eukprot:XP_013761297.1 hypothetical protein AMSG_01784 [Thecamonas trahens ATCC 50062]